MRWPLARSSSSRSGTLGTIVVEIASSAAMRDVRLVISLLSSTENFSALTLHELMASTVEAILSCPVWRALTSSTSVSSFSSVVVILDVRVGGFFPRCLGLGGGGGGGGGGVDVGAGDVEVVGRATRVNVAGDEVTTSGIYEIRRQIGRKVFPNLLRTPTTPVQHGSAERLALIPECYDPITRRVGRRDAR